MASNTDRIRAALKAANGEPKAAETPKVKATPAVQVKHRCGCSLPLTYYAGADCGKCRNAKRQAAAARRRAGWEQRKQTATATRSADEGRLPDGAAFEVEYDAATQHWAGSLKIPTEAGHEEFTGQASGVFKLLATLDAQYRATHGA